MNEKPVFHQMKENCLFHHMTSHYQHCHNGKYHENLQSTMN